MLSSGHLHAQVWPQPTPVPRLANGPQGHVPPACHVCHEHGSTWLSFWAEPLLPLQLCLTSGLRLVMVLGLWGASPQVGAGQEGACSLDYPRGCASVCWEAACGRPGRQLWFPGARGLWLEIRAGSGQHRCSLGPGGQGWEPSPGSPMPQAHTCTVTVLVTQLSATELSRLQGGRAQSCCTSPRSL